MIRTIYRHKCDYCGKTQDEGENHGFLPQSSPNTWSAWSIKKKGTASMFYGGNPNLDFCCHDCAINWLKRDKDKDNKKKKNENSTKQKKQ